METVTSAQQDVQRLSKVCRKAAPRSICGATKLVVWFHTLREVSLEKKWQWTRKKPEEQPLPISWPHSGYIRPLTPP
jgi:hypothetical protein